MFSAFMTNRHIPTYLVCIVVQLLFCSVKLNAQLPEILPPPKKPGYCDCLKSDYFLKSAKTFMLRGPVKSVVETISPESDMDFVQGLPSENRYEFLPNGNLIWLLEDTVIPVPKWSPVIEEYTFDSSGTQLLKARLYEGVPRRNSLTEKYFDRNGYVIRDEFSCINHNELGDLSKEFSKVMDYTLTYHWKEDCSAVDLKYQYKTRPLYYERYQDHLITCPQQTATDSAQVHGRTDANLLGLPFFDFFNSENYTYDSLGRVVSILFLDRVIKNSMNIDRRTDYVYSEMGDIKEITFWSSIVSASSNGFVLNNRISVDYLSYDEHGNWTKCRVFSSWPKSQDVYCDNCVPLIYARSITYY